MKGYIRPTPPRDSDQQAYVQNAREHLKDLSSIVNDYLTNKSDLYVKTELLQEIDVIDGILSKL